MRILLVLLLVALMGTSEARHARGGVSSASAPPVVQNLQVVLQGETGPDVAQMAGTNPYPVYNTNASPNLNEIAWTCSAGADTYIIMRGVNGGTPSTYATISASSATSAYSTFVTNQGSYAYPPNLSCAYLDSSATGIISATQINSAMDVNATVSNGSSNFVVNSINTGVYNWQGSIVIGQGVAAPSGCLAIGTTLTAQQSGTAGGVGTYTLSSPATCGTTTSYGTVRMPNTGYTYQVIAQQSGVQAAASAYAYLPLLINGQYFLDGGIFNGTVTLGQSSPATTPLGYSYAFLWTATNAVNLVNPAVGQNAPANNLSITGYNYLNIAMYTSSTGVGMQIGPEIAGDYLLYSSTTISYSTLGCTNPLTSNAWNVCKVPFTSIWEDNTSGTNALQDSFYKITYQVSNSACASTNCPIYMEIWATVN